MSRVIIEWWQGNVRVHYIKCDADMVDGCINHFNNSNPYHNFRMTIRPL